MCVRLRAERRVWTGRYYCSTSHHCWSSSSSTASATRAIAVVGALAAAGLEIGYSLYVFGQLDEFTYVSVGLIAVFGGLSLKLNNPIYFKFKPVILGLLMAATFFVTYALDKPLLLVGIERYGETLPEQMRATLKQPQTLAILERASLYIGFGLIVQAAFVGWAALRLGNWWWLVARSAGFYLMMTVVVVLAWASTI